MCVLKWFLGNFYLLFILKVSGFLVILVKVLLFVDKLKGIVECLIFIYFYLFRIMFFLCFVLLL